MPDAACIPFQFSFKETVAPADFVSEQGACVAPNDTRPYWKRTAYSLLSPDNPLILCCLEGARGSLSSQIAAQMSAASALDAILSFEEGHSKDSAQQFNDDVPLATAIVRSGIKTANADVYSYAHKMGAGGKIGATGFVSCFAHSRCSIARVGAYAVYACRDGRVLDLFEQTSESSDKEQYGVLQRFIGANSQVLVDLISLELKAGDSILFTSQSAENLPFGRISDIMVGHGSLEEQLSAFQLLSAECAVEEQGNGKSVIARNAFTGLLKVGAPVITLTEVLE
jgi:hypothetical protein